MALRQQGNVKVILSQASIYGIISLVISMFIKYQDWLTKVTYFCDKEEVFKIFLSIHLNWKATN